MDKQSKMNKKSINPVQNNKDDEATKNVKALAASQKLNNTKRTAISSTLISSSLAPTKIIGQSINKVTAPTAPVANVPTKLNLVNSNSKLSDNAQAKGVSLKSQGPSVSSMFKVNYIVLYLMFLFRVLLSFKYFLKGYHG